MKTTLLLFALALTFAGGVFADRAVADETSALAKLRQSVDEPKDLKVTLDRNGRAKEISVNGPNLTNDDLALFNEFSQLERLTISHAGYSGQGKTGVSFAGVAQLKAHPTLKYFSAGGAIGKEFLAALPALTNVPELYVQTTHSADADWAPVGTMKHLTYLGIRVRNDLKGSKLTDHLFDQLLPLVELERLLISEMTFNDPAPFVKFVTTRPKLRELTLKNSNLSPAALAEIRQSMPKLEIIVPSRD